MSVVTMPACLPYFAGGRIVDVTRITNEGRIQEKQLSVGTGGTTATTRGSCCCPQTSGERLFALFLRLLPSSSTGKVSLDRDSSLPRFVWTCVHRGSADVVKLALWFGAYSEDDLYLRDNCRRFQVAHRHALAVLKFLARHPPSGIRIPYSQIFRHIGVTHKHF